MSSSCIFDFFCGGRGFCHKTGGSDLFLFLNILVSYILRVFERNN